VLLFTAIHPYTVQLSYSSSSDNLSHSGDGLPRLAVCCDSISPSKQMDVCARYHLPWAPSLFCTLIIRISGARTAENRDRSVDRRLRVKHLDYL
jgi:hypothetical protein